MSENGIKRGLIKMGLIAAAVVVVAVAWWILSEVAR